MRAVHLRKTKASVRDVWHRAGRAVGLSRLVLSSVFLLAIYIDPSQPAAAPEWVYPLLGIYVALAFGMTVVAWRSWWWDNRLAGPMHVADLLVFAAVVFSTEGYTSPFFTFSLFVLLSASIRWGARQTARTAMAVNLLFVSAGLLSGLLTALEIDVQRLLIRSTYLIVLSLLCIWFTLDRDRLAQRSSLRERLQNARDEEHLPRLFCDHVAARVAANRILTLCRDEGEPWDLVCERDRAGDVRSERGGELETRALAALPNEPFLFDNAGRRLLVGNAQHVRSMDIPEPLARFARERQLGPLLGIPVRSDQIECGVFVCGLPRLSIDDLTLGAELAEELAFLQRQGLLNQMSEQAAMHRARLSIGRDLHDSVAQVVAGISFRLEAFKRSGKSAQELAPDIELLQDELATEQRQLRMLIADLRRPGLTKGRLHVASHLATLSERLGRQWDIACTFTSPSGLQIGPDIERELNQMIREGVANAVRHGRADRVAIVLQAADAGIALEIIDNGRHRPSSGLVQPRTLNERAASLGGTLEAKAGDEGTRVRIELPRGGER